MPKFCVFIPLLLVNLILPFSAFADNDSLLLKIKTIAQDAKGKVSVSAFAIEDSISVSYYGDELCVMQSVFKYPVAIAILDRIDKGEFSLQHKIHFTPEYVAKYTGVVAGAFGFMMPCCIIWESPKKWQNLSANRESKTLK